MTNCQVLLIKKRVIFSEAKCITLIGHHAMLFDKTFWPQCLVPRKGLHHPRTVQSHASWFSPAVTEYECTCNSKSAMNVYVLPCPQHHRFSVFLHYYNLLNTSSPPPPPIPKGGFHQHFFFFTTHRIAIRRKQTTHRSRDAFYTGLQRVNFDGFCDVNPSPENYEIET